MTDCGDRKPTLLGFDAVCCREAGHEPPHESADFAWLDQMNWASMKGQSA